MAKAPKKTAELNEEAAALCKSLRIAMALDKQANCVTHGNKLIAVTSVGTVYTPFDLSIASAFKVEDLLHALEGCVGAYTITEDVSRSELRVSWGRRRATLKTLPKISIYAPPIDAVQNTTIGDDFKEKLCSFAADLIPRENDVTSALIYFEGYQAYWTNLAIAARFQSTTWIPPILMFAKDVRTLSKIDGKIVGIGGTAHSITFHFEDNSAIQLPLADDSSVSYPTAAIKGLFSADVLAAEYPITPDFLAGLNYVSRFADQIIYVSPEHVGTDRDPQLGTAVDCTDIPLTLMFLTETIKLGAFKGAEKIIKTTSSKPIGFATQKADTTFMFVKLKERSDD